MDFRLFMNAPAIIILYLFLYVLLALYPAGSVAACQSLHFFPGHQVEVAGNGVLQRGRRHAVLQCSLEILAVQPPAKESPPPTRSTMG